MNNLPSISSRFSRWSPRRKLLAAGALLAALLIIAAACSDDEAIPQPTPIPPSPIPASELARLSPSAREALIQFVVGHRGITGDWEQFHLDFDLWREGLVACDASSVTVSLLGFASDFAPITEAARGLPRSVDVRGLSDELTAAAVAEEKTLRELRDGWSPGATSLFEAVDLQRSASADVRKRVADRILDLVEQTSSESRALVDGFADATSSLNRKWDSFHADYEGLRAEQPTLKPSVLGARLSGLVSQFSDVAQDARALPTTPSTRSIAKILVDAVEQEDLVLRKLRGIFSRTEDLSGEGESISSTLAFDEFDIALVNGNAARREAAEQLADVVEGSSSENEMAVAQFSDGYDQLVSAWSAFDQQYEAWRRDEGGCDRAGATQALSQFTVQFSGLATRVRVLPRLEILQSLGEVFVEAAEREEQALRNLRTTWRPFDSEVYGSFDQERSTAGQFRRQVAAGLNELITQHDISGGELAR